VWETILEYGWAKSWPKAWLCGKEMGILPHYYFPWMDLRNDDYLMFRETREGIGGKKMKLMIEKKN
jgi:hypothetical protein